MIIVKFECGCVGFRPEPNAAAQTVILTACDTDSPGHEFCFRDMSGKTFQPLTPEATQLLVRDVQRQLCDGSRFRDIQDALGIPRQ